MALAREAIAEILHKTVTILYTVGESVGTNEQRGFIIKLGYIKRKISFEKKSADCN